MIKELCPNCDNYSKCKRSYKDAAGYCDGFLNHNKRKTSERPADLPEAGASAERISSVIRSARELVKFGDWILASKIHLCDKRCLMKDIDTEFGNVKSNYCERESCPELVLKLLLDDVRAHFL